MNLSKILLATTIAVTSCYTQAALINAADFAVGTEISQLDNNTTISWIQSKLGKAAVTVPVSIQTVPSTSGINTAYHFSSATAYGGTDSVTTHVTHTLSGILYSLEEVYTKNDFEAMLISYIAPTRQITIKGFDNSSDGFSAVAFNKDGKVIDIQHAYAEPGDVIWQDCEPFNCSARFNFSKTIAFSADAYYVMLGGNDTEAYLESIDVSVPEPSSLLLLGLAGITLLWSRRKLAGRDNTN